MNVTVALGSDPVVMPCRIRGQILYWVVNHELYGAGNVQRLRHQGITFSFPRRNGSQLLSSAVVAITETNNNTVLVCEAQIDNFDIVSSDPATILIAGWAYSYI